MEGFRNDLLADVGPVGVRRWSMKSTPSSMGALEERASPPPRSFGFAPDAFAGEAHGAKSEAMDRSLAAEGEGWPLALCRECGLWCSC